MRRCVLPAGSSAARWRQACARFYATTKKVEGVAKRPRGRPPKPKQELPSELGNGGKISAASAEALPASIGTSKLRGDLISTSESYENSELQTPAPKSRGRPRIKRGIESDAVQAEINTATDRAASSVLEAVNVSEAPVSLFQPISPLETSQEPPRRPRDVSSKKQVIDRIRGASNNTDSLEETVAQTETGAAPISPLADPATQISTKRFPKPPSGSFPTPRERPLPMSPLMDPAYLAAKAKHKGRKGPPTKGSPGSFQARLAKNPYALALATPIRCCAVTGALLPTFFLQDFNMMAHPETGAPWYVPTSLQKLEDRATKISRKIGISESISETTLSESLDVQDLRNEGAGDDEDRGKKIGHNTYFISSKLAFDRMQQQKGFHPAKWIPQRLRRIPSASKVAQGAGWRRDMGDFMHELWRRRISEQLIYVESLKKGYMVNCTDWDDAMCKSQVGAFLWIGKDPNGAPKQWATIDVPHGHERFGETRKVPVYNLRTLLGDETLEKLIGGTEGGGSVIGGNVVAVKVKRATLELRMKLWKFQGYLALPEEEQELVFDDEEDEDWDENEEDGEDEDYEEQDDEEERPDDDQAPHKIWTTQPLGNGTPPSINSPWHMNRTREPHQRNDQELSRRKELSSQLSQGFTVRREEF